MAEINPIGVDVQVKASSVSPGLDAKLFIGDAGCFATSIADFKTKLAAILLEGMLIYDLTEATGPALRRVRITGLNGVGGVPDPSDVELDAIPGNFYTGEEAPPDVISTSVSDPKLSYGLLGDHYLDILTGNIYQKVSNEITNSWDIVYQSSSGSNYKLVAASTANVPLGVPVSTLDGVTIARYDKVLLKDQSPPILNGIYQAIDNYYVRLEGFDQPDDGANLALATFDIMGGATNKGKRFVYYLRGTAPNIGTTFLYFYEDSFIDNGSLELYFNPSTIANTLKNDPHYVMTKRDTTTLSNSYLFKSGSFSTSGGYTSGSSTLIDLRYGNVFNLTSDSSADLNITINHTKGELASYGYGSIVIIMNNRHATLEKDFVFEANTSFGVFSGETVTVPAASTAVFIGLIVKETDGESDDFVIIGDVSLTNQNLV